MALSPYMTIARRPTSPRDAGHAWVPIRPWQPILVSRHRTPASPRRRSPGSTRPNWSGRNIISRGRRRRRPGTWWQIYFDGGLVWTGQRTSALIPVPLGVERIDIGMVGAGYETTSWSSELPPAPARRAVLSWVGGAFLGDDIAGFYVYAAASAGGMINYTTPAATITAYPVGIIHRRVRPGRLRPGRLRLRRRHVHVVVADVAGRHVVVRRRPVRLDRQRRHRDDRQRRDRRAAAGDAGVRRPDADALYVQPIAAYRHGKLDRVAGVGQHRCEFHSGLCNLIMAPSMVRRNPSYAPLNAGRSA